VIRLLASLLLLLAVPAAAEPAGQGPDDQGPDDEEPADEGPDDEGPADEEPASEGPSEGSPSDASPPDQDPYRLEIAPLPELSYDSDLGLGFGVMLDATKYHPDFAPYRANLNAQAFLVVGPNPDGGVRIAFQNHWVRLDLPGLLRDRLRLRARVGLRHEVNARYYGIGNASVNLRPWTSVDRDADPEGWAAARRRYDHQQLKPYLQVEALFHVAGALQGYTALIAWWNWVTLIEDSKLSDDLAGAAGEDVTALLVGARRHGALQVAGGLVYDTRDDEAHPTRGMLHELTVRGGPTFEVPGGYGGLHLETRFFAPLLDDWLVVAARLMADALFGDPPFPELARYGGQRPDHGPGGAVSVRGVPLQRYHGKIKVIGNLELRSKLIRFNLLKRPFALGLQAFFDAGRVWTEWRPNPVLDGAAIGLKLGLGGGLRLYWGGNFVVRGDVGWSPDGVGVYFDVGHIF